jgi:hypothetical protein
MAFSTGHYGYGLLEQALGAALEVGENLQRGPMRSRLKRLASLGLPAPLRGQEGRRLYSLEEGHQLLVALLLENLGLDPVVVARAVNKAWARNLAAGAQGAAKEASAEDSKKFENNPIVLYANLRIVTEPWRTGDPNTALHYIVLRRRYDGVAIARYREKHKMSTADAFRQADEILLAFNGLRSGEWMAGLNYSEVANKFQAALHKD